MEIPNSNHPSFPLPWPGRKSRAFKVRWTKKGKRRSASSSSLSQLVPRSLIHYLPTFLCKISTHHRPKAPPQYLNIHIKPHHLPTNTFNNSTRNPSITSCVPATRLVELKFPPKRNYLSRVFFLCFFATTSLELDNPDFSTCIPQIAIDPFIMPSHLPSFASAAAGQGANRDSRTVRGETRGSGDWATGYVFLLLFTIY